MPLPVKSIAVKLAVLCFFGVCIVGVCAGVPVDTCGVRGMLAAVVAYMGTSFIVRVVNGILTQAMVASWLNTPKEDTIDDES